MKKAVLIIMVSMISLPQISEAAFPTCGEARKYGKNVSTLFTELVYEQAECNEQLIVIYERFLAGIGANPLTTNDPESIILCYFEGHYNGLMERIPYEYSECLTGEEPPEYFSCIPMETVAMFATNVVIGAALSIDILTEDNLQQVLVAEADYPICEEAMPGSCSDQVIAIAASNTAFQDEINAEEIETLLVQNLCP